MNRRNLTGLAVCLLGFLLLYRKVIVKLISDWATDDNYSHGFLIVPLAAYWAFERRHRLAAETPRPTALGLLVVLGSLAVLVAGTLGAELFLTRISILGVLIGVILFVWGAGHARILRFPLAFLVLMIPLPAIVFNQIAFPLQLVASRFGETVLRLASIPVLREGNIIVLSSTTLEVAEACSGIRSLVSLMTLGIVLGYFSDPRTWVRAAIALSTVPVAIVANGLRVAGTGLAAHRFGPEAATGFFHTFSGWLVFVFAFLMLFLVQRLVAVAAPVRSPEAAPAS